MDQTTVLYVSICLLLKWENVQAGVERRDLLDKLTNTSIYDCNYPANYDRNGSANVSIQVEISDVLHVDEHDMEYSSMMLLRMKWDDTRLAFHDHANFTQLELIGDMVDHIWIPDVFISNERQVSSHSFVKHEEVVYISPDGTVSFRMRVSMTNYCPMQLKNFPFDEQKCYMKLKSYTFTADKLLLEWSEPSVYTSYINLTNFEVVIRESSEGSDTDDNSAVAGGWTVFHIGMILLLIIFNAVVNLFQKQTTAKTTDTSKQSDDQVNAQAIESATNYGSNEMDTFGSLNDDSNEANTSEAEHASTEKLLKDNKRKDLKRPAEDTSSGRVGSVRQFLDRKAFDILSFAFFLQLYAIICTCLLISWSRVSSFWYYMIILEMLFSLNPITMMIVLKKRRQ